jgi:sugar phosphate isomerase/epimerase
MTNPITFSTLACPQWSVDTVVQKAVEFGYDGLEWRGGPRGHINPNSTEAERSRLRQLTHEAGLMTVAVTAYTSFVSESAPEQAAQVDTLREYADLAAGIEARYVRAFLGQVSAGQAISDRLYDRMAASLAAAAEYAHSVGVAIAVEPHDDFVRSASVAPLLQRVSHAGLGVIWDLGNTWAAGEDVMNSYQHLAGRLAYVQVKDGRGQGKTWQLGPVGKGEVPIRQAINLLMSGGYSGAFSVEWEWAWHPELDPPDVALPAALSIVKALLRSASPEAT